MDFTEYLKDKRVALVGPSPSIIGSRNGQLINSCDIVIRMNKAVPVCAKLVKDIGSRTDILYNCLEPLPNSGGKIDIDMWQRNNVKWLCSSYPIVPFSERNIRNFITINDRRVRNINFRCVSMATYTMLATVTKTRPNTGLMAIVDLLSHPIKSLFITGMTFGEDGYYKEYSNIPIDKYLKMANGVNHQQYPQFEYFCDLIKRDMRICPDETLIRMIK